MSRAEFLAAAVLAAIPPLVNGLCEIAAHAIQRRHEERIARYAALARQIDGEDGESE